MRVLELWRYPVKSMQGEQVARAEVTSAGIEGDRQFALFDAASGAVLTARRDPQLLFAHAGLTDAGAVRIVLPDGSVAGDDAALSQWLGRPVQLRAAEPARTHSPGSPDGYFQDSTEARVSLISLATVGAWAPRRFRSNVLLDGEGEDGLVGSEVELGSVRLAVGMHIERCVMTTRPQPGGIDRDREVLRVIHREHGGTLSVGATVSRPGRIRVGDTLELLSPAAAADCSAAASGPDQGQLQREPRPGDHPGVGEPGVPA